MAWIKIVRILNEFSEDVEVEIKFCWGKRATKYNTDEAIVFLKKLKEALENNDLSKLASAFNVTASPTEDYFDILSQYVALLNFLWNWNTLRKAKWVIK